MSEAAATPRLEDLIEEIASLLEATVRAEEGIFHLTVPISVEEEDESEEAEDDPDLRVTVALSTSEDGSALYVTRRLCANDGSVDLEELLRAVNETVHVQLSIDEDDDIVLGGACPAGSPVDWIADMVGEIAELAPELAEDTDDIRDEEFEGEDEES
ncbi:MAG: hypothetical protein U0441_10910 [Polyangiaceae bacterium]